MADESEDKPAASGNRLTRIFSGIGRRRRKRDPKRNLTDSICYKSEDDLDRDYAHVSPDVTLDRAPEERASRARRRRTPSVGDILNDLMGRSRRREIRNYYEESDKESETSEGHGNTDDTEEIQRLDSPEPSESGKSETGGSNVVIAKAVAKTTYIASPYDKEFITLREGEIIDIFVMDIGGNWKGQVEDRCGLFKYVHVKVIERYGIGRNPRDFAVELLLQKINLKSLLPMLIHHGFDLLDQFAKISSSDLDKMRVFNETQRATILTAACLVPDLRASLLRDSGIVLTRGNEHSVSSYRDSISSHESNVSSAGGLQTDDYQSYMNKRFGLEDEKTNTTQHEVEEAINSDDNLLSIDTVIHVPRSKTKFDSQHSSKENLCESINLDTDEFYSEGTFHETETPITEIFKPTDKICERKSSLPTLRRTILQAPSPTVNRICLLLDNSDDEGDEGEEGSFEEETDQQSEPSHENDSICWKTHTFLYKTMTLEIVKRLKMKGHRILHQLARVSELKQNYATAGAMPTRAPLPLYQREVVDQP
eukprot:GHVU01120894.1.p1 GENE.GHVU01120894.1~~GHVU01120894.1.p1  ORF type:complete len:546 (-),score=59.43 GHVU01120894.1:1107-2720(-)